MKFIVCNADEGDPVPIPTGTCSNSAPAGTPGMFIAGYAIGAQTGTLHSRRISESITAIEQAIETLRSAGLKWREHHGSGFSFDFKIIKAGALTSAVKRPPCWHLHRGTW